MNIATLDIATDGAGSGRFPSYDTTRHQLGAAVANFGTSGDLLIEEYEAPGNPIWCTPGLEGENIEKLLLLSVNMDDRDDPVDLRAGWYHPVPPCLGIHQSGHQLREPVGSLMGTSWGWCDPPMRVRTAPRVVHPQHHVALVTIILGFRPASHCLIDLSFVYFVLFIYLFIYLFILIYRS